jgi:hypothetical protein
VESAVLLVRIGDRHIPVAEAQARVAFPVVVETVDVFELDPAERVDEQPRHPAAADRRELQRVTDEHDPPSLHVGEVGEFGEFDRWHHPRFVDDRDGADREIETSPRWAVEAVLDEESVGRVSRRRFVRCDSRDAL